MSDIHPIIFNDERRDIACKEETAEIWVEIDDVVVKMANIVKKLMDKAIDMGKGDDMERETFARCSAKNAQTLTRMIVEIKDMRPY